MGDIFCYLLPDNYFVTRGRGYALFRDGNTIIFIVGPKD